MKRTLIIIFLLAVLIPGFAREPQRGYRGFVNIEGGVGKFRGYDDYISSPPYYAAGVSTTHGYQINSNWFAGVGILIQPYVNFYGGMYPVYAEGRYDKKWGKFTPFADLRLGYNIDDGGGDGVYLSPSIGYRFNFGRKVNLNVGLGMSLRSITYMDCTLDSDGTLISWDDHLTVTARTMFTFRLGVDF